MKEKGKEWGQEMSLRVKGNYLFLTSHCESQRKIPPIKAFIGEKLDNQ